MKIVKFEYQNEIKMGVLEGKEVKVISGNIFTEFSVTDKVLKIEDIKLLAPCQPGKIIGAGLNYHDAAEKLGLDKPAEPIIFLKAPTSVIGPNDKIKIPAHSKEIAFEVELAVIIGKEGKDISEDNALEYIFGYTIANDITSRDYMRPGKPWALAKSFDTFTPLGPVIETELNPENLKLKFYLNDQLKQDGSTRDMIFNTQKLISYISQVMTLEPGDIILTGTPYGGDLLNVGDKVRMEIERIGLMSNEVV